MVKDKIKPTSIRLSPDLLEEIDQVCEQEGCSRNDKIENLIEDGLNIDDSQEPKIEYRDKEVIKEVIKEVPKIEYRDKIVKVPEIQTKYVDRKIEVPKITAPEHLPAFTCSQGCNHTNKNYKKRVKSKCYNCDQFNKNETGKCSWCGSTDLNPIDKDELKDLGIPLPNYDGNPSDPYPCPNSNYQCSVSACGI